MPSILQCMSLSCDPVGSISVVGEQQASYNIYIFYFILLITRLLCTSGYVWPVQYVLYTEGNSEVNSNGPPQTAGLRVTSRNSFVRREFRGWGQCMNLSEQVITLVCFLCCRSPYLWPGVCLFDQLVSVLPHKLQVEHPSTEVYDCGPCYREQRSCSIYVDAKLCTLWHQIV